MKLLIIGAGGVGTSAAKIIERAGAEGDWAEKVVVADYDLARAEKVANEICGGGKFVPAQIKSREGCKRDLRRRQVRSGTDQRDGS